MSQTTSSLVSWEKLATPKVKGGMEFGYFHFFNLAKLGKHGWRLMHHPKSLCARVLKGRYYSHWGFLQATTPARASTTWKAIVVGKEAFKVGLIHRVGAGTTISRGRMGSPRSLKFQIQSTTTQETRTWKLFIRIFSYRS